MRGKKDTLRESLNLHVFSVAEITDFKAIIAIQVSADKNETSSQIIKSNSFQHRWLSILIAFLLLSIFIGLYELVQYLWNKWRTREPVPRENEAFEMQEFGEIRQWFERNAQWNRNEPEQDRSVHSLDRVSSQRQQNAYVFGDRRFSV
ncbi:hypothetical protein CDAR_205241 [Caerostris darwini]|uniref:Uncharacterized protein n=1 Tax=Caerostris darwini TaxID=1538125 RepID=A0AAV4WVN3_9ARAC|nr:hypothetical protein CDAR_205241 [Caerostris darwini]